MTPDSPTRTAADELSTLLEALSSQLVVIDRECRITAANGAWRDQTRIADYFTAFQLVARPDFELQAAVRAGIGRVQSGTDPEFVAEFAIPSEGERRWVLLRAAPLETEPVRRILIAHVDITARKRAERMSALQHEILSLLVADTPLRTSLDRLCESIAEEAPGSYCVVLVRAAEADSATLGAAPGLPASIADQLNGVPISNLFHFVDGPAMADVSRLPPVPWVGAAAAHGFQSIVTVPVRSKSGSDLGLMMLWYRTAGAPSQLARSLLEVGASLAAVAVERNRTVRALRERDTRFQSVFTLQPDAVFTLDREAEVLAANPAAEQLLGEVSDDLARLPFTDLIPEPDHAAFLVQFQRALNGYPQRFTMALQQPGRARIDADATLVPLVSEGGIGGVYLMAKDITGQMAAADRLANSRKQLRQSSKMEAVGRLAGGVAHDFNNLLTAIRGYTELLLDNPAMPGTARDDLGEIARAVSRATSLTRQLLTFSRQQVIQLRLVDLNLIVDECRGLLSRLVRAETTVVVLPSTEPYWVEADPIQLHQVIINLAVNAHDAMPGGGSLTIETSRFQPGADPETALIPLEPGDYITLTVRDTGRGMDAETQARVFEPFFTTKPPGHGTGLGLSTVYGIVEQAGGRVGFRSAPDQGTTFVVYLPARPAPEGAPEQPNGGGPAPVLTGTETILVAEDEDSVRGMVRKILTAAGYNVLEARHGADAILVSREYPARIDLLLTDVVMPEMNGLRLAEVFRAERPAVPVIFMSGYTRDEVDRKGLTEPGVNLIQKPFTVGELGMVIRTTLDRKVPTAPN